MKFTLKMGLVLLSLIITKIAFATNCESSCQLEQVNTYFAALDKVSRKGSSIKDIDRLLASMHDDVQYIHVEYDANFNKQSWRKAFIRNLERGAYQNGQNNEKRILNTIFGKNHIAVEYSHGVIQQDGSWKQDEPLLVLFGFSEGKIILIKELW